MSQPASGIAFDAEYDLVVVGSGGSGKSAALEAAKSGLTVAILEKMPHTGGSSMYAEGTAACESSEQQARGVPEDPGAHFPTREETYRRFMDYSHYRADPEVVRMFVNNSAETIDILKSIGVEYTDVRVYNKDQPSELYTFHRPDGLGARVQELLLAAVEEAGVEIFTSTRVEHLVIEGGAVIGVAAKDVDGNDLTISARAVILATGGYGNDPEMVHKLALPGTDSHVAAQVPLENTGDGIRLALEAGGTLSNTGVFQLGAGIPWKTLTSLVYAAALQPWLWVNRQGKRFVSEEVGMSFSNAGAAVAQQPLGQSISIIDSDCVTYLGEEGCICGLGDFIVYGQKLTALQDELDGDVADGRAWRADTIEDLARQLGIDPQVLADTVAANNAHFDAGHDPDFFKPAKYQRAIRKAPFYAIPMAAGLTVSCGAIRVNGDLQVLTADLDPISGLYAVGNDASGLYGDSYNIDVPGATNGFAHTSGRVAARHVIASAKRSAVAR